MTVETRQTAWAAALYAICTVAFAWPLSGAPGTRLLSDDPDGHLYVWTMAWNAWALATQPLGLFDANIFHPERLTLAYSENLIGTGLFAAPVLWLTDNPVLALNLALLVTRDDVAIRSVSGRAPYRTVQAATLRDGYRSPAVDA
ncbi:MAG: hypothetical protein ACLGHP_09210, partial [Vicinamibacteria bacterium]